MSQQIIDVGLVANDHTGDPDRTAFQKINDNFTDLYAVQSRTVNAGDIRFQVGPTIEARITLAIAQAVLEQATAVYIPAFMLPYDAALVTFDPTIQMVREGGNVAVYDLLAYGAASGGANAQPAIIAAIAAADAAGGGTVFAPTGRYRFKPSDSTIPADAITVPAGVYLMGDGYNSVFEFDPASYITDVRQWRGFFFNGNSGASNFRIDGKRGDVSGVGLTSVQILAVLANTGNSGVIFEHLWIHDVYGLNSESFGILTQGAGSRHVIRSCKVWNVNGSGISVSGSIALVGDWTLGNMTDKVRVEHCEAWDNTYMGITFYGVKNCTMVGGRFDTNGRRGINLEWTLNIDLWSASCTGNTQAGLGTYGKANVRAHGLVLYGNNPSLSTSHGEVDVVGGAWYTGSPAPSANGGTIELLDCSITPTPGGAHVFYDRDTTVNIGYSLPDAIIVRHPEVASWIISAATAGSTTYFAAVQVQGTKDIRAIPLGKPNQLANGSTTITAYAGTGNQSTDAVTITGTGINQNASGGYVFKAGRTYRLRVRCRQEDINSEWSVKVADSGNVAYGTIRLRAIAADVAAGVWFTHDMLVTPTNDSRIQVIQLQAAGSSAVSIDWWAATELADKPGISYRADALQGCSADRGDANVTLFLGTDVETQLFLSALSQNRTVTLAGPSTGGPRWEGGRFRIVRQGLGNFTLDVGGLKTIPSATAAWVDVQFSTTLNWQLVGYGTL